MPPASAVAADPRPYPQHEETTAASAGRRIFRWVAVMRARARTRRILRSLDAHTLRDIGLTHGDIDFVERDPRYSPRHARL